MMTETEMREAFLVKGSEMETTKADDDDGAFESGDSYRDEKTSSLRFRNKESRFLLPSPGIRKADGKLKRVRSGSRPVALVILLLLSLLLMIWRTGGGVGYGYGIRHGFGCGQRHGGGSGEVPLLLDATVEELAAGLEGGLFTSRELVEAYLHRIDEVNGLLRAVVETNPDALAIAAVLDGERSAGKTRGPLHGLPILLKNNIATHDLMNNTAGSYALLGATVPRDATVAQKLRYQGAILLGKVNLSQWAHFRSFNISSGWSAHGGQTYGPYLPFQDPGGSSSGSGVAIALGLAVAALGTETAGSIISPSSNNNIVGIKPTVGLTSRHLVIPISEHQDTVGPMARTVKDAAYVLQAIAGHDPRDNYTSTIPKGTIPDYVAACNISSLSGARIGVPSNVMELLGDNTTEAMIEAFDLSLDILERSGATIVEGANFTAAEEYLNRSMILDVAGADFLLNLAAYFDSLTHNPYNITNLSSLRNFTHSHPLEAYPQKPTEAWDTTLQGYNNTDPRFWPAYLRGLYFGEKGGLLGALDRHDLDAVVLPAIFAPEWAAATGAPIVSVPLGAWPAGTEAVRNGDGLVERGEGFPFGLAFLGRRFDEARLIGFAYAFEQRSMVRRKLVPYVQPETELADVLRWKQR